MKTSFISNLADVNQFLSDLKAVINHSDFDPDQDLEIILKKKSESFTDPYTTRNTLLALGYDHYDVVNELNSLTSREYIETIVDDKFPASPYFYYFGQIVQGYEVYIKVKIRDKAKRKVFCVSFHFARHPQSGNYPHR